MHSHGAYLRKSNAFKKLNKNKTLFQARQILESEFDRLVREGTNRQVSDGRPGS
jgi:hypothetical protein